MADILTLLPQAWLGKASRWIGGWMIKRWPNGQSNAWIKEIIIVHIISQSVIFIRYFISVVAKLYSYNIKRGDGTLRRIISLVSLWQCPDLMEKTGLKYWYLPIHFIQTYLKCCSRFSVSFVLESLLVFLRPTQNICLQLISWRAEVYFSSRRI